MVIDTLITTLHDRVEVYIADYGIHPSVIILNNSYKFTEIEWFRDIPIIYSVRATKIEVY